MKFTSVEDVYRSFITANDKSAKRLMDSSRLENPGQYSSVFEELAKLLYPSPAGALLDARGFWNKLKELSSGFDDPNTQVNEKRARLAQMIRIYHANLANSNDNLSNEIRDFYAGAKDIEGSSTPPRPSAYKAYSPITVDDKSFVDANLSDMFPPFDPGDPSLKWNIDTSLTYILIDSPVIDLKTRRADKAEVFLNYMPSLIASQLNPYMEVEFTQARTVERLQQPIRNVDTMSPLRFLLGSAEIPTDNEGGVDRALYDASIRRVNPGQGPPSEQLQSNLERLRAGGSLVTPTTGTSATGRSAIAAAASSISTTPAPQTEKVLTTTGMDLFMMPQTLLNMDYDQVANPRFNVALNSTLPLGTIVSANISVNGSLGTMSYKTAQLVLKVFDRSRMPELADFINPKLYKSTTIWMTYGWRAPTSIRSEDPNSEIRTYYDFINENMLIREAYGVRNTSMSIDSDGSVTITLDLYTLGSINILEATDTLSEQYNNVERILSDNMTRMSNLARSLGLQAFVEVGKDLRGSTLLSAAIAGDLLSLDYTTLIQERDAIKAALETRKSAATESKINEFLSLLSQIYVTESSAAVAKGTGTGSAKLAVVEQNEQIAKSLTTSRFSGLKDCKDLFGYTAACAPGEKVTGKDLSPEEFNPLKRLFDNLNEKAIKKSTEENLMLTEYGEYGTVSFGRVFAYYFANIARALTGSGIIDEFQVVFYKLNDFAGLVGGINIAEFPIEMYTLQKAYAKRVQEQKGEKMSFNLLLETIRESQFGDMRNRAYGFRDLYSVDAKTGELVSPADKQKDLANRILKNNNQGGTFTLPSIEFYVEVGYKGESGTQVVDLLEVFNMFSYSSVRPSGVGNANTRVMRIHVYDRAASPNSLVHRMLKFPEGYVEINDEYLESLAAMTRGPDGQFTTDSIQRLNALKDEFYRATNDVAAAGAASGQNSPKQIEALTTAVNTRLAALSQRDSTMKIGPLDAKKAFRTISFTDATGSPSFERVKEEISRLVPTIRIGTNGTAVSSVSYSTNQEALLSTIMMLRASKSSSNPSKPNGSADGDLPLRVVPGQLSLSSLGCPLVEYMQQFFVDLGTGTTADNLYNITGITHSISVGKFESQFKFTFADAYGQFEGAQNLIESFADKLNFLSSQIAAGTTKPPGTK